MATATQSAAADKLYEQLPATLLCLTLNVDLLLEGLKFPGPGMYSLGSRQIWPWHVKLQWYASVKGPTQCMSMNLLLSFSPALLVRAMLSLVVSSSSVAAPAAATAAAREELAAFYRGYLAASSKVPVDAAQVDALRRAHVTAAFQKKLQQAELDADPFLNAQDVDEGWAAQVRVAADGAPDRYRVCLGAEGPAAHCVLVRVVLEANAWRIDGVSGG